ncbi:Cna B-type domain-containing protein [Gracilibacillus sp. JCM 18860]|uniref:Cna B-type domain-containing protein n=1 Tax=Gracilibacillus sp. JCM 18860 TaxID=1306159 RepID=UPI000ABB8A32
MNGYDITNTRSEKVSVEVTKGWLDDGATDRPTSIQVTLQQNGKEFETVELTEADGWEHTFANLEAYDENGIAYVYTVTEEPVKGYETRIDGYDITNVRVGKTEVVGTKTWKDDNAEDRPTSITVELLQNGEVIDTKEVTEEDEWKYSFTDLAKYDENGVAYEYTVQEQPVEGYQATVDGYDITNVRVGTTEAVGTKTWKDDNAEDRPTSITVELLQNGEVIETTEVTAEDEWKYSFIDLAKYDENGVAYEYTVQEQPVEGYQATVDGYDITNVRVGTTEVIGTKTWKDDNAEDRPTSITVELLQSGEVIDTTEVTEEDEWKYSFTDLAKYDENGVAYEYVVQEQPVEGYETTINGYEIINTLLPISTEEENTDEVTPDANDNQNTTTDEEFGSSQKGGSQEKGAVSEESSLPNTATSIFNIIAYGIGVLIVGVVILLVYRKKEQS